MTEQKPAEKPRSRRMIVWLVAAPIVILLLALAGANWKTFHLAYAKHLMSSEDREKQRDGVEMVLRTHLRKGMSLEEVRRLLAPARVIFWPHLSTIECRFAGVYVTTGEGGKYQPAAGLTFDENDRLSYIKFIPDAPRDGK